MERIEDNVRDMFMDCKEQFGGVEDSENGRPISITLCAKILWAHLQELGFNEDNIGDIQWNFSKSDDGSVYSLALFVRKEEEPKPTELRSPRHRCPFEAFRLFFRDIMPDNYLSGCGEILGIVIKAWKQCRSCTKVQYPHGNSEEEQIRAWAEILRVYLLQRLLNPSKVGIGKYPVRFKQGRISWFLWYEDITCIIEQPGFFDDNDSFEATEPFNAFKSLFDLLENRNNEGKAAGVALKKVKGGAKEDWN